MFKLSVTNGALKFLVSKSVAVLFTRKRKLPIIELKIEKGNILFINEFDYLEVCFQTNGTYNKHTKYILDRCSTCCYET